MARHISLAFLAVLFFAVCTSSVIAQNPGNPFKNETKKPFQTDAVDLAPKIEIDLSTMRQCFEILQYSLQISADQGRRAAARDEKRIFDAQGSDKASVLPEKITKLDQRIEQTKKRLKKRFALVDFTDSGRAEFDAIVNPIKQNEIIKIRDFERLKLKIRLLEAENKNLKERLEIRDNANR